MINKLFLLDGMALVYRAHFALVARPILSSKGVNTSALYGFTQTLLEILNSQQPTHIAVAFDTDAPTKRHTEFAGYKATREAMPEDIVQALPHVRRLLEAFRIPVLTCDGFEADDIIGTLVRRAQAEAIPTYMVTPDKDFGQLISENTFLYKPSRMGDGVEIMGLPEIRNRWGIERPEQVIDILALMGDASDNIPGVPGIGEKTAVKLIGQYGSVENLLAHTSELSARASQTLESNKETALLSKRLATIDCNAPCQFELESMRRQSPDEDKLKAILTEFEFNSIGRRLFGEEFRAGRGFEAPGGVARASGELTETQAGGASSSSSDSAVPPAANLKTLSNVPHDYREARSAEEQADLLRALKERGCFSMHVITSNRICREATLLGLAFSFAPHTAQYVRFPTEPAERQRFLDRFRPVLESEQIEKVGHDLKFELSALRWHGIVVRGKLFDTMVAHSLLEPDTRHGLRYLSESSLGYTPLAPEMNQESSMEEGEELPLSQNEGTAEGPPPASGDFPSLPLSHTSHKTLPATPPSGLSQSLEVGAEFADLAIQLREVLEPLLKQKGQERVFYEIESPLIPVLVEMEFEGIRVDAGILAQFSAQLAKEIFEQEKSICALAGAQFNLNSPRQLGQILFDVLKICPPPKKTKTGQYATDEQTLAALASDHEIVRRLLEYRTATKLKSTYADTLPAAIWPSTGRIHTTFNQVSTSTGRLNSQDPNLQNIPIRTERGQEIRKAFVPRDDAFVLLSADYSQIELRIIAALSREQALRDAFEAGLDIHSATAARVYGVFLEMVTPEMRRKAKMVNYGIAYGISAFGLAQRLGIPRKEASSIIEQYFQQFPRIRQYMEDTIAFAREHGYVETVTGRRRYIRDIRSSNNTVRSSAERNAINAPIQGSAADLIKLAMILIQNELTRRGLRTRMLLQVHDELLFDLYKPEEVEVRALIEEKMKGAIALDVPMVVELGVGVTWLEAH